MNKTIGVLGLDAADYRLCHHWDCENILLDRSREIETFSYSLQLPKTSEVWPTIATGVHPREHEVSDSRNMEWKNPVYRAGSILTSPLPDRIRTHLGNLIAGGNEGLTVATTDHKHVFDDGVVYEWPGVVEAPHFIRAVRTPKDEVTKSELDKILYSCTGKEMGWLKHVGQLNLPIVGVQCHVLDVAGHTFASDEETFRSYYEYVDQQVAALREWFDTLVIVSDHGFQTEWMNDEQPGYHSWHPLISIQGSEIPLPESVFDVRDFLEELKPEILQDEEKVSYDTPEEHLKDLGYI